MLEGKNAIVYGAGGIGRAMAIAFAGAGATVHLASRTRKRLDEVAGEIREAGGRVETAVLDAQDEAAVSAHAAAVAESAGSIDVSVNVITHGDVQGTPLVEMSVDDFMAPVINGPRTTFLTATAAARHMIKQGSGVILLFGGNGDPPPNYHLGGLQVGFSAMEALRRGLASELGRHGIRVLTLRTGGIVESIPEFEGREAIVDEIVQSTMLKRAATFADVGNVAVFAASDLARTMTAATLNISCGALID